MDLVHLIAAVRVDGMGVKSNPWSPKIATGVPQQVSCTTAAVVYQVSGIWYQVDLVLGWCLQQQPRP